MFSPSRPRAAPWSTLRRAEGLVVGAFLGAVILIGAGGWMLRGSMVRHRATADETLRDHAAYMAISYSNSVQTEAWFGIRTLLRIAQEIAAPGAVPQGIPALRARAEADAIGPGLPPLLPVRFLAGDRNAWSATARATTIDSALAAALDHRLDQPIDSFASFIGTVVIRQVDTTLVFAERGRHGGWVGVELPLPVFRTAVIEPPVQRFRRSFIRLRDSLRIGRVDEEPLSISVRTRAGVLLYTLGPDPDAGPSWSSTLPILGSLQGEVRFTVLPPAVPALMPGGYPADPGPRVLAATIVAMLILGGAAVLAWRTLALSRLRDEFTSTVPHELRTPLTNIQLWAETLLLERARTPEDRRTALETITRETRRLVHLVENVLAFSRVGRPNMRLVRHEERVERLVQDAVGSFGPLFRAHGIEPVVEITGTPDACVDGDAIRRILVNLIDNAVRYGPDGQRITIRVRNGETELEVMVEDEGPGIPAADRERVWRPYERGRDETEAGTGIGLAVVRQLVTLHGGTAEIGQGAVGARITIRLPATAPDDGRE